MQSILLENHEIGLVAKDEGVYLLGDGGSRFLGFVKRNERCLVRHIFPCQLLKLDWFLALFL